MCQSILYRAIGLPGYQHQSIKDKDGVLSLRARPPSSALKCPECGTTDVIRRGTHPRLVHAPPMGTRSTVIFIDAPRVQCRSCERVPTIKLPGVVPGTNHTYIFARMVVDLRKVMTVQDISIWLGVSTTMVRDIDKRYLETHFDKPRLRDLKTIAIDEISIRKGHTYMTIVMDLESGAIVFAGKGKGQKALKPFWKRLRGSGARIKAAATDMSSAYYAAVLKNLPDALLVFDRFHPRFRLERNRGFAPSVIAIPSSRYP